MPGMPLARRGRPPYPDVLTPAEWSVLQLLRHGLSSAQIARLRRTGRPAVTFHLANIAAKLQLPSRAALRHWPGVPAGSALAARNRTSARTPSEAAMPAPGPASTPAPSADPGALGPIGQLSLLVTDIERATAFYRDTLGLPHLFTFDTLAFFDCAGTRLFLSTPETTPEGGSWRPSSVLYFRVEDIAAAHARLAAAGVPFVGAPHLVHRHESGVEEWMAFFADPDGNTLALMAQVAPAGA